MEIVMGIISGIIGSNNGRREAEAIEEGNAQQIALSREALDLQRPIFEAGDQARNQQLSALGLNGLGAANDSYGNFEDSGFYRSAREGFDVDRQYLDGSAAAAGSLFSGAHARSLDDRARERASGAYGQFYNGLAGISGAGQVASSNAGSILQNQGAATSNAFLQAADARSQGASALGGGITSTLGGIGTAIFGGF